MLTRFAELKGRAALGTDPRPEPAEIVIAFGANVRRLSRNRPAEPIRIDDQHAAPTPLPERRSLISFFDELSQAEYAPDERSRDCADCQPCWTPREAGGEPEPQNDELRCQCTQHRGENQLAKHAYTTHDESKRLPPLADALPLQEELQVIAPASLAVRSRHVEPAEW